MGPGKERKSNVRAERKRNVRAERKRNVRAESKSNVRAWALPAPRYSYFLFYFVLKREKCLCVRNMGVCVCVRACIGTHID